jgi:hypothetical protein
LRKPAGTIRYILACAAALLSFLFLALLPIVHTSERLERQITDLRTDLREQRALKPLFRELTEKTGQGSPSALPFPKETGIPESELGKLSTFFQRLASSSDFEVVNITPDMVTFSRGTGPVRLETVMRGPLSGLRGLMIRLGELPFLSHIETVEIKTVESTREVRLKVWLTRAATPEKGGGGS